MKQHSKIDVTMLLINVIGILLMTRTCRAIFEDPNLNLAQCEAAVEKIEQEDRATFVDDSPSRLHSTWLSQECEMRAGPEYIIRKYTFFKNSTFLLQRYHYADESCSVAKYTVVIRGTIMLLGPSSIVFGATETKFHVDTVNIIPLNLQVARKFGYKLNSTCGPRPRWRVYVPQLVYVQPRVNSTLWQYPMYNSLRVYLTVNTRFDADCLEPFGIEFAELSLLRVQKRSMPDETLLFLASPPSNVHLRSKHKPTSLESMPMVRFDKASGCSICGIVIRGTEFSPPVLHQAVALPVLIGGYWHSERCESCTNGVWCKRWFQIHLGDKLWTGQWDYYDDPQCSTFLYTITATGSYRLRAPSRWHPEEINPQFLFDTIQVSATQPVSKKFRRKKAKSRRRSWRTTSRPFYTKANSTSSTRSERVERPVRSLTDVYQFLYNSQSPAIESRYAAMMRGQQTYERITRKPPIWSDVPTGTAELDLHVAESVLIPGDIVASNRCSVDRRSNMSTWLKDCAPRDIEAPSILRLRAKLGVNWYGQYILMLGLRGDDVWQAPLRQCAETTLHNRDLRTHLRKSYGLRFGLISSTEALEEMQAKASAATSIMKATWIPVWFFLFQFLCYLATRHLSCYRCYLRRFEKPSDSSSS